MIIWFYILIFCASCLILAYSGTRAVHSLIKIAHFLKWKEFIVAFILMAFATSLPELFVGISSAVHRIPQLSLGDIFGANILNLTLTIGLVILLFGPLQIERKTTKHNSILMAIVGLLPLLLLLDGNLSRIDGVILIMVFIFYIVWLFARKEFFSKIYKKTEDQKKDNFFAFLKNLAYFLFLVGLLLLAAQGIIRSASFFAEFIGIPLGLVGILLVGVGTAFPEIYFSIQAGKAGQSGMILGNLMGTIVVNSTLILGLVALIYPIKIDDFSPYSLARIFLLISVLFFLFLSRTESKISKKEGFILILIYLLFLFFEIAS